MPARAVSFDHELLLRPPKVGDDGSPVELERHIYVRWCEAAGDNEVKDDLFELGTSWKRMSEDALRTAATTDWTEAL